MSQAQNTEALAKLDAALRRLKKLTERCRDSSRFRNSPERSAELVRQVRQAARYAELASDALELEATPSASETGWLGSRVSSLVRYLTKATPDAPEAPEPPRGPAVHEGSGLKGHCASLSIPDLLAMLQGQGKTGVLRVEHPAETIVLHLSQGQLVHAFSENTPDGSRLGQILVRQGALDQERLDSVLFCHGATPRKLGEILLEGRIVDPADLETALSEQVQELFHRLFVMQEAQFHFQPGLPAATEESRARMNVIQLLLESARVHDERQAG